MSEREVPRRQDGARPLQPAERSVVLLVRHARAGERSDWCGDDRFRPLSFAGRTQALEIASALAERRPSSISSSPAVRCVQTVAPLAEAVGLRIGLEPALAEGSTEEAVSLARAQRGVAVLCTHGDVGPAVLARLAAADGLRLPAVLRQSKGSTWVLETVDGRFSSATYHETPRL
ncbi:MAG: SixA phosphatase family protein [Acidimicrobiales bacterium]